MELLVMGALVILSIGVGFAIVLPSLFLILFLMARGRARSHVMAATAQGDFAYASPNSR